MDELDRIKTLESELAAELEKARREGEAGVEKAEAGRKTVVAEARRRAESEAGAAMREAAARADAECARIKAESDKELKELGSMYKKNYSKAVGYVLKELGA